MTIRPYLLSLSVLVLAGALSTTACLNRKLSPAEPAVQSQLVENIGQRITKLDMLFVIDNSKSMGQEQEELSRQVKIMVRELLDPANVGSATPPPVRDLHIGVVSTDVGILGHEDQACKDDGGRLQNSSHPDLTCAVQTHSAADCTSGTCPWLTHSVEHPDDVEGANPIWDDFACIATLGTGGCNLEQPLEAMRLALDPEGMAAPDGDNAGFMRPDSLLAIVFVTDEDDCSTDDPALFDPAASATLGLLNTRCAVHSDRLTPVEEYYDFLIDELRGGNADNVVVAGIIGLPDDEDDWRVGDLVEDLAALQQVDPENTNDLVASCTSGMGLAYHPVRLVDFAYRFGDNALLHPICQQNWSAALRAITIKIQAKLAGVCASRPLASTSSDVCRVVETLGDTSECPNAVARDGVDNRQRDQWRVDMGTVLVENHQGELVERRQCEILSADADGDGCPDGAAHCVGGNYDGSMAGWFYETTDGSCDNGRVQFTHEDVTTDASDVRFECLTALCPLRRQCGHQTFSQAGCRQSDLASACGDNEVLVRHHSRAICGFERVDDGDGNMVDRDCSCATCTPTLAARCSNLDAANPAARQPLITSGGCCAVGFHCENDQCVPDRTTECTFGN
jgi:hypothetical protein